MFQDVAFAAGVEITKRIIALAELLTNSESSPGLVAGGLMLATLGLGAWYWFRTHRQMKAIRSFDRLVRSHDSIETFADGYEDFRHRINNDYRLPGPRETIWEAWDEFSETLVPDDIDGPIRLRNSIRPASFLNIEDLGFGPTVFRIVPNTLVSAGLFLTFLGLVAALHKFSANMSEGSMDSAMQTFMQIASAKFTMSLVGLFCSIIFTYLLRVRQNKLDHLLHRLCTGIERRLVFVSLEDIGFRQLQAAEEQKAHLQEIGTSMVAQLKEPLDALPSAITTAISSEMKPIFEKVGSMGSSNMEGLVGDLSNQLSHSVGNALTRASESLGEATDRIGTMVDRMSATNNQAGDGLRDALDQMAGPCPRCARKSPRAVERRPRR